MFKIKYVMWCKLLGKFLKFVYVVDCEYCVMSVFNWIDFLVFIVFMFCDDELVVGIIFYVMSYIEGCVFWDLFMLDLLNEECVVVFDLVNVMIVKFYLIDYKVLGLEDFGWEGNYFV